MGWGREGFRRCGWDLVGRIGLMNRSDWWRAFEKRTLNVE